MLPTPTEKDETVKFLSDSFAYCGTVIPSLTEKGNRSARRTILPTDGSLGEKFCWLCMCM